MQTADPDNHADTQAPHSDHSFAPCSCCRALAQVRMPHPIDSEGAEHNSYTDGNGHAGKNGHHTGGGATKKRFVFGLPNLNGGNSKTAGKKGRGRSADEDFKTAARESAETGKNLETGADSGESHDPIADLLPKKRRVWQGLDGVAVLTFGVMIPALMAISCCLSTPKRITLLLLNHPAETSIELILIFAIPVTIYLIWASICKKNIGYTLTQGLAMGATIGSALISVMICVAALFYGSEDLVSSIGTDFTSGFCWLAFLSMGAALTGIYLVNRIRLSRDFSASRMQVMIFTVAGMVLSLVAFVGAEARPWSIRLAERKAVSTKAAERTAGLQELRALDAERELRMECSDARAAGLSGLFIPLKATSQRDLYFAMTGKPYNFTEFNSQDVSNMPDDDLKRTIVGDKVKGLSLIRSSLDGVVHPETLSSTVNWTFVFKNGSQATQESRSELALPPGAVVTGLTLWRRGEPQAAIVAAAGKAEGFTDARWEQVNLNSPATISDLGHGRMLLHLKEVQPEEELKVGMAMVVPLKPDGAKAASLTLPTFLATNFDLNGFSHTLKLRSTNGKLSCSAKNLLAGRIGDDGTLTGSLKDNQLESSSLTIEASRNEVTKPIVVFDKMAVRLAQDDEKKREDRIKAQAAATNEKAERQIIVMIDGSRGVNNQVSEVTKALNGKPAGRVARKSVVKTVQPRFVVENVTRVAAQAPKHLVVVVDGSAAVKPYAGQLANALAKLPVSIKTDLIVASQEDRGTLKNVADLRKFNFVGGQNNLQAVVNAAEIAGEQKGGAVLWVHGPQPAHNEEIYIMSQYAESPNFYELQVGTGNTDAFDFFKNHSEIGPFTQVTRSASNLAISADLAAFFSKWQPDSNDYAVSLAQTTSKPEGARLATFEEAEEVLALNASKQCASLIADRHIRRAARIAVAYGVVTPVSCALITDAVTEADDDSTADSTSTVLGASAGGAGETTESEAVAAMDSSLVARSGGSLQGVTNGTIAPQGKCMYVTGINTAGTVRVNNLANLEALLNIIANLAEIGCALAGAGIIIYAIALREPFIGEVMGNEIEVGTGMKIAIGVGMILLGLAVPGLINWFVASARDANLFN